MARTNDRVTGVIVRNEKILLIHRLRDGNEYRVFPGGGVEEGEDFLTALKREMKEETGLDILSCRNLFNQTESSGTHCIFYECEMEPGEPRLGGPELEEQSTSNQHQLEWVDLKKFPNLKAVYPDPKKLIDVLQKWVEL